MSSGFNILAVFSTVDYCVLYLFMIFTVLCVSVIRGVQCPQCTNVLVFCTIIVFLVYLFSIIMSGVFSVLASGVFSVLASGVFSVLASSVFSVLVSSVGFDQLC